MEQDFSTWLKYRIARTNMSVSAFCRKSGIPLSTLNCWLYGTQKGILLHNLSKLADAFGVSLEEVQEAAGLKDPMTSAA